MMFPEHCEPQPMRPGLRQKRLCMNQNPRSSSGERPLGPHQQRANLEVSGSSGGPIRLPEEFQDEFIGQFNSLYLSHALQIAKDKGAHPGPG